MSGECRAKYALCKHGPSCRRYSRDECSFAHKLSEVSFPHKGLLFPKRWVDESVVSGAPSGIDLFVGQRYTYEQHSRLLKYVAHSTETLPDWVKLYLWFEGHPDYKPVYSQDIGWFHAVVYDLDHLLPLEYRVRGTDLSFSMVSLLDWRPPFKWAVDTYGFTFEERMRLRLANALPYWVSESELDYKAPAEVSSCDMCFELRIGDRFILLEDEEQGWCWGVRYDRPRQGGYIPWGAVKYTDQAVVLDYRPSQDEVSLSEFITEHDAQHLRRDDVFCITPSGFDLRQHSRVAVCFCDGSTADRMGFAAACNCIYPDESRIWKQDAAGTRMYCVGSATAELVALCITFLNLIQDTEHYKHAVVYCDSSCAIKYVGDSDWEPTDLAGWKLLPLILYCRNLHHVLTVDLGRPVHVAKVSSSLNRAHTLAKRTLQRYKETNWFPDGIDPFVLPLRLRKAIKDVEGYTIKWATGELTKKHVCEQCFPERS